MIGESLCVEGSRVESELHNVVQLGSSCIGERFLRRHQEARFGRRVAWDSSDWTSTWSVRENAWQSGHHAAAYHSSLTLLGDACGNAADAATSTRSRITLVDESVVCEKDDAVVVWLCRFNLMLALAHCKKEFHEAYAKAKLKGGGADWRYHPAPEGHLESRKASTLLSLVRSSNESIHMSLLKSAVHNVGALQRKLSHIVAGTSLLPQTKLQQHVLGTDSMYYQSIYCSQQ